MLLWPFSLKLYGRPEVAQACHRLQDEHGVDVLVVLVAAYSATILRRNLGPGQVAELQVVTSDWRSQVIEPLRRLRRDLKRDHISIEPLGRSALRDVIKNAEVEAERLQLSAMERWLAGQSTDPAELTLSPDLLGLHETGAGGDELALIWRVAKEIAASLNEHAEQSD